MTQQSPANWMDRALFAFRRVLVGGTAQNSRGGLNFIGATVADNPDEDRIDITIPSAGAAGGSLAGAYPNPTVVQLDGASGNLPILATNTKWQIAGSADARIYTFGGDLATIDATPLHIPYGPADLDLDTSKSASLRLDALVAAVSDNGGGTVECASWLVSAGFKYVPGPAMTLLGSVSGGGTSTMATAGVGATWQVGADVSGGQLRLNLTGSATTVKWALAIQIAARRY